MNSQSRILIANLPSFAAAANDLARVIQIVWLLFNKTTVNGDKNGILAVTEFQTKWSDNTQLDLSGEDRGKKQNLAYFSAFTNCWKAEISSQIPFLTV